MTKKNIRPWFITVIAIAALLPGTACRQSKKRSVDRYAQQYVQLAVSLGEHDPDSLDYYSGPAQAMSSVRSSPGSLIEIRQKCELLLRELQQQSWNSPEDAERAHFLQMQLNAISARTLELSGQFQPFDTESSAYFNLTAGPYQKKNSRNSERSSIAKLLGNPKNLPHAYTTFDATFTVPLGKVAAVFNRALTLCKDQTQKYIALPANEHIDVEFVFHKPWSAYSRYQGNAHSIIQVNLDFPLTVDRILDLACHEGYPGHHVFNTLRDQALVKQQHRFEWTVQPTFSPQSFLSEAAASYAPELAFTSEERTQLEKDELFPLAGLPTSDIARYITVTQNVAQLHTALPTIARDYLDGKLEFVRASDAIEQETLMEHGETLLLYLNEYRSYMLTYTLGRDMVQSCLPDEKDARWKQYRQWMIDPEASLLTCSKTSITSQEKE